MKDMFIFFFPYILIEIIFLITSTPVIIRIIAVRAMIIPIRSVNSTLIYFGLTMKKYKASAEEAAKG
jgi:hypothetical protein